MNLDNPAIIKLVDDLAADLKPEVAKIEASLDVTQNHYGKYMHILLVVGKGNRNTTNLIALALIKAGANRAGVTSALQVIGME